MKAKIQRWGNSLAIRISKPFAAEAGLALEELLARVTDESLHGEIDFGSLVGREVW